MFHSVVLLGRAVDGLKNPINRHILQGRDPLSYWSAQLLPLLLVRASFDGQGRRDGGSGGIGKPGQEGHVQA